MPETRRPLPSVRPAHPPSLRMSASVLRLLLLALFALPARSVSAQLVEARLGYRVDAFASSPVEHAAAVHDLDAAARFDLSGLGWRGGRAHVHARATAGASISERVAVLQSVSSMEGPDAARVFEAWIEQRFAAGRASLRGGLYDLNTEFYTTGPGGLFVNSAHGIGPDITQSGRRGPSTYPVTGLGARLRVDAGAATVLLGVVDGVPGTSRHPGRPSLRLTRAEGAMLIAEGAVTPRGGRVAVGAWGYTREAERLDGGGTAPARGAYVVVATAPRPFAGTTLAAYGRLGTATPEVHVIGTAWGGGITATGIAGRQDDALGLGVAAVHTSAAARAAAALDDMETVLELTYSLALTPSLRVQPDVQWTLGAGAVSGMRAWVFGIRIAAALERSW